MEIKGLISAVLPIQTGNSSNGNSWVSQEFVLKYYWWPNQTSPSSMVLKLFGEERVKSADVKVGEEVKVGYHIEAREYQGRWYNDVRCDYIERKNKATPPAEDTDLP